MSGTLTVELVVARAGGLGALPASWHLLDAAANRPTSTIDDLAEAIGTDAGLTARLLRLANSPMFGMPGRVESIAGAVTMIGTRQIRDLALATTVIDKFTDLPESLVNMHDFWRHSLASAVIARTIASHRREANAERFFVTGLLLDIGSLLLYLQEPKLSAAALAVVAKNACAISDAERQVFGFDHADLSAALLKQWGLPNSIHIPVGRHHQPGLAIAFRTEITVVHIASTMVDLLAIGGRLEGLAPPMDVKAWSDLNIQVEILADAVAQLDATLEPIMAAFFPPAAAMPDVAP